MGIFTHTLCPATSAPTTTTSGTTVRSNGANRKFTKFSRRPRTKLEDFDDCGEKGSATRVIGGTEVGDWNDWGTGLNKDVTYDEI